METAGLKLLSFGSVVLKIYKDVKSNMPVASSVYKVCELYLPQVACLVLGSNISDDQPIRWSAQLHHQTMLISAEIALSRNLPCMKLLWTKSDIVCQLTLILI